VEVYNNMKLELIKGGMTEVQAIVSLEALKGDNRPTLLVINDKKELGGKLSVCRCTNSQDGRVP
jgi:hypothetical protein